MTTALATAANQIAARHANVVTKFEALKTSATAGRIDSANAEAQATALGQVRADLEAQMDAVLRLSARQLAEILMPSIKAHAEAMA